jgi:N-acetylneuraminic acid mutarotase
MPDSAYTWGTCAVVYDNLIYIMGGRRDSFESASTRIAAYDPDTDSYTGLTAMPSGVSDGACAVVDNSIYYFGGYLSGGWGLPPNSLVFIYDINDDSWQTAMTAMPVPRANSAAIAVGASVFIVGGWDGTGTYGGFYNTVDAYDTTLDQWTVGIPDPLGCVADDGSTVKGRSGLTLHKANDGVSDHIYAVGGTVGISLPTRCNESAPIVVVDLIFEDGFESGDTTLWSASIP